MLKYLENLHDKLPDRPQKFLFGDQELSSVKELIQFVSIYFVLVSNPDFDCERPPGEKKIESCRAVIQHSQKTVALAGWFKKKLTERIGQKMIHCFRSLLKQDFRIEDVCDILFCQGYRVYYRIKNKKNNDAPESAELFKQVFMKNSRQDQKKILSKLPIVLFDICLAYSEYNVFETIVTSGMFGCLEEESYAEVSETWSGHLVNIRIWWQWYKRKPIEMEFRKPEPEMIPVLERIVFINGKLEICYYKNNQKCVWYTIDSRTGTISYKRDNGKSRLSRFHFPLQRPFMKIYRAGCKRKKASIIDNFFLNAIRTISVHEMEFQNLRCLKTCLKSKINECIKLFMAELDPAARRFAINLSCNSSISWESYQIYMACGKDSTEVYRVEQFFNYFPSLARIVPAAFLTSYVSPGKSLKKAIPYWTEKFRNQAEKQAENRNDAYQRIMRSIIEQLAGGPMLDYYSLDSLLNIFRIKDPFAKQPEAKESLLRFCAKKSFYDSTCISQLVEYVLKTGHIVHKKNSLKGFIRSYNRWIDEQNIDWLVANGHIFPDPWFSDKWHYKEYTIRYVSSYHGLLKLAEAQKNCVDSKKYLVEVLSSNRQFYQMEKNNSIIATISLENTCLFTILGDCLGKRNSRLGTESSKIIKRWFENHREYLLPHPHSTGFSGDIKLKSKIFI